MASIIKNLAIASLALMAIPATTLAQKEDKVVEGKKSKDEKGIQQITITRTGDKKEKMTVEIDGDKITVNGKDIKDYKDADVNVTNIQNQGMMFNSNNNRWAFSMDGDDAVSFNSEDANRAMLGVNTEDDDKGAKIVTVTKESGADKAGLKKGDVITKINTTTIEETDDVTKAIRSQKPGDKVSIDIIRDGKKQTVSAELTKWKGVRMNEITVVGHPSFKVNTPVTPVTPEGFNGDLFERQVQGYRTPAQTYRQLQGFSYTGKPRLGLSIQDTEDGKGVKVTDVEEDGAAEKAGLKEDDVITSIDDAEVKTTDDITKTIKNAAKDKYNFNFKILRNGKSQTVEVKLPRKLKTADL